MGVVSGITMSFQFGTNWPGYMEKAGNIAGPLLGYEVLTAFFLEATFLGVMLFGRDRVPGWMHTLSAFLVAFGTTMSAFWILALNSWMHTPQGFEMIDGELARERLDRDHLQSELPVSPDAHADGLGAHHVVPRHRHLGLPAAAQPLVGAGAADAEAARGRGRRADAGADLRRRPARPQHARAPAGEDRRHRRHLAHGARRAAAAVRDAERDASGATTSRSAFRTARA